jgi:hypothetical protein
MVRQDKAETRHVTDVASHFQIPGSVVDAAPYGSGHINDTYAVTTEDNGSRRRWLFQRINTNVFKNVDMLMENISRATSHIRSRMKEDGNADPDREVLTLIPTAEGDSCLRTPGDEFWRCYIFIENASSYDVCRGPEQACEAAKAFRSFEGYLADLPAESFNETIPFFHHSPKRFEALERAIAEDPAGRAADSQPEISFAGDRKAMTSVVVDLMKNGEIPARITHNDTKLNNVLLDDATGKATCVIDLDTVMPGSILYDFGDMVRTATPTCLEDEQDLSKVDMDMDLFQGLVRGYLEGASFITQIELEHLAFAGRLITFTIGIRFLADHLAGDTYFKVHRPNHNLERARVQFKLVELMEERSEAMEAMVREHC